MTDYIDIVFDGPPSHKSGRFVEVEDESGRSVRTGQWVQRRDGFWVLRLRPDDITYPFIHRNSSITRAVLDGVTLEATGKKFGITSARVGQIVRSTCRSVSQDLPPSIKGNAYTLRFLRKNKESFLQKLP